MKIKKVPMGSYGPSFNGKFGKTDFYQFFDGEELLGELEVLNKDGRVEILSLIAEKRNSGIGTKAVDLVFNRYKTNEVFVLATTKSRPFWVKMGGIPYTQNRFELVIRR